jgi:hypothetical protein
MICDVCFGRGVVVLEVYARRLDQRSFAAIVHPCPECGGCGRAHCCDGLREQPSDGDESKA